MLARLIPILLPISVALATCLWRIQSRQLWRDEHATWWAATLPWDALLHLLSQIDAVIAPYYLMMRGVVALAGGSALALRLPSALAVALAAGALALVGKRLFDARVGAFAGLLLALPPSVSRYGQEARPYAFALLFTIGSVLLLLRALERPSARRFALYGACVFLLGCAHLVALCSLIAHPFLLFEQSPERPRVQLRRGVLLPYAVALALALTLLVPLAYLGRVQAAQISWTRTMALAHGLGALPEMMFNAPRVGRTVMLLGLCALWRPTQARIFVGAWAILPLAFLFGTRSLLHLFIHRYLLFALPAWCLLAAIVLEDLGLWLARLTRRAFVPYLLAALLGALLVKYGLNRHTQLRAAHAHGRLYDYRGLAAQLRAQARSTDAIAFSGFQAAANWARMAMQYELRDRPPLRDVFVAASAAEVGWLEARECDDPAQCLPADVERLWLVVCPPERGAAAQVPRALSRLLERNFVQQSAMTFHNIELALFARPTSP